MYIQMSNTYLSNDFKKNFQRTIHLKLSSIEKLYLPIKSLATLSKKKVFQSKKYYEILPYEILCKSIFSYGIVIKPLT